MSNKLTSNKKALLEKFGHRTSKALETSSLDKSYISNINDISINAIITFEVETIEGNRTLKLKGREAQTLYCLIKLGNKGATALDLSSWAIRLASYIYKLRHEYNIDIHTDREPNSDGLGTHGKYYLLSTVKIINIKNNKEPLS